MPKQLKICKMKKSIKVTPNYSKRTFTIRVNYSDGSTIKYRTNPMNQDDFDNEEMNTENDWRHFLNQSQDYYRV